MIVAPEKILKQGTDVAAGWEVGRNQGLERSGNHLRKRLPPAHLIGKGNRYDDWKHGYELGLIARKGSAKKLVCFTDVDGQSKCIYKSGSTRKIIQRLEAQGICGDVTVTYPSGKEVRCGI